MDARGRVEGQFHTARVVLYALSTCGWCGKMRQLLEEADVTFDYIYVDLVSREERASIRETIRCRSQRVSFPTVCIDDAECIVGYRPETVRARLGLDTGPLAAS